MSTQENVNMRNTYKCRGLRSYDVAFHHGRNSPMAMVEQKGVTWSYGEEYIRSIISNNI